MKLEEMKIFNLTQHPASPEQIEAGVSGELTPDQKKDLNFSILPSRDELNFRAETFARYVKAKGYSAAMIGGAPFFMVPIHNALVKHNIKPLYAFSVRESIEKVENGKTVKTSIFKHAGFVG